MHFYRESQSPWASPVPASTDPACAKSISLPPLPSPPSLSLCLSPWPYGRVFLASLVSSFSFSLALVALFIRDLTAECESPPLGETVPQNPPRRSMLRDAECAIRDPAAATGIMILVTRKSSRPKRSFGARAGSFPPPPRSGLSMFFGYLPLPFASLRSSPARIIRERDSLLSSVCIAVGAVLPATRGRNEEWK